MQRGAAHRRHLRAHRADRRGDRALRVALAVPARVGAGACRGGLEELAGEIAVQIQRNVLYPGQIRVTVIRELRATEVAR